MKSGDNNLDAHRETKTVRDVLSPYRCVRSRVRVGRSIEVFKYGFEFQS